MTLRLASVHFRNYLPVYQKYSKIFLLNCVHCEKRRKIIIKIIIDLLVKNLYRKDLVVVTFLQERRLYN